PALTQVFPMPPMATVTKSESTSACSDAVVFDLWSIANRIIERAELSLFQITTGTDGGGR
ncbi:MAG: hypothetical protein ACLFPA_07965, partial [Dichotomicrobium sp.]